MEFGLDKQREEHFRSVTTLVKLLGSQLADQRWSALPAQAGLELHAATWNTAQQRKCRRTANTMHSLFFSATVHDVAFRLQLFFPRA